MALLYHRPVCLTMAGNRKEPKINSMGKIDLKFTGSHASLSISKDTKYIFRGVFSS